MTLQKKKKIQRTALRYEREATRGAVNQWHREPLSSKHPLFWEVIKSN